MYQLMKCFLETDVRHLSHYKLFDHEKHKERISEVWHLQQEFLVIVAGNVKIGFNIVNSFSILEMGYFSDMAGDIIKRRVEEPICISLPDMYSQSLPLFKTLMMNGKVEGIYKDLETVCDLFDFLFGNPEDDQSKYYPDIKLVPYLKEETEIKKEFTDSKDVKKEEYIENEDTKHVKLEEMDIQRPDEEQIAMETDMSIYEEDQGNKERSENNHDIRGFKEESFSQYDFKNGGVIAKNYNPQEELYTRKGSDNCPKVYSEECDKPLGDDNSQRKPHSCENCGKSFPYASYLKRHERFHTGEKPHSCDACGETFAHLSILKGHKRIHTGEKPYSCDVCGKTFITQSNMKQHKRIHTGAKPYSCDMCGKTFTQQSNLKRHERIHTHEKPFSCGVCGKAFNIKKHLKRHIFFCHNTESFIPAEESTMSVVFPKASSEENGISNVKS